MNSHLDEQSILDLYRSGALLDKFDSAFQVKTVISKCAELHNEGEIDLIALIQSPNFERIDANRFFARQYFYSEVIPLLNATPRDMMKCVKALVEKGGQDFAAGLPNAAFRKWCSADLSRAAAVIESSEADDPLACDFLPFALAAGNMVQQAIRIADAYRDERRVRAIVALSSIDYADLDSATAALGALKRAMDDRVDDVLYANILIAALGIAEKANSGLVDKVSEIVKAVCTAPGPQTQYCCAHAISANSSVLNPAILDSLFGALASIPPELKGTLRALDNGLLKLLGTAFADEAIAFIAKFLTDAEGTVALADFPGLGNNLVTGPHGRFHRTLVRWMLSGKRPLCEGLAHLVNMARKRDLFFDMSMHDFELTPQQKIFLCKKAIGYFFVQPVIAASILVAVLRDCDNEVATAVSDLLFDPLLINYRGELKDYLESIPQADPAAKPVRAALDAGSQYLSGLRSTGLIRELLPAEHRRQIERMRLREQSREIHKQAREQSVFHNLVHRVVLLYGRRSLTYVGLPGETGRPIEMQLHAHTFSQELPQMEMVDPIGLDYMLRVFRAERLPE